ncbi:MAG: hypothetical protein E7351_01320 [Clostridiales bacterium]|nr:hypothetical protein [Clostridiales bacterium]
MNNIESKSRQNLLYRLAYIKIIKNTIENYVASGTKSLIESFKDVFIEKSQNLSDEQIKKHLEKGLKITLNSLLLEIITLQKEALTKSAFDEKMNEDHKIISKLREKFLLKKYNINNNEFYKYIRDSFAHNSIENPNFIILDNGNFLVKLRKNKDSSVVDLEMSAQDLFELLLVYNSNISNLDQQVGFYQKDLKKALVDKSLTVENIDNFIQIREHDNQIKLDEYQKKSLVNYFNSCYDYALDALGLDISSWSISSYRTPFKNNHVNIIKDKIKTFTYLVYLIKNIEVKSFDFEVMFVKNLISNPINEWIILDYYSDIVMPINTNYLYSLLANCSPQEIQSMSGDKYLDKTTNLRNAIIHGRYFYNYDQNDGIEIYDGRKELNHIMTLSVKDMENFINNIKEENFEL